MSGLRAKDDEANAVPLVETPAESLSTSMVLQPDEIATVELADPLSSRCRTVTDTWCLGENGGDASAARESVKILLRRRLLFWLSNGSYLLVAVALTLLNEWVPCKAPVSRFYYFFPMGVVLALSSGMMQLFGVWVLAPSTMKHHREVVVCIALMVVYLLQLSLRMYYWLDQSWYRLAAQEFFFMNYAFMFIGVRWIPMHYGVPLRGSVGAVFAACVFIMFGYQLMLNYVLISLQSAESGAGVGWIVLFLAGTQLAHSVLKATTQRLLKMIARRQGRDLSWPDLLASQVFCSYTHFFQLTYYRMIFTSVPSLAAGIALIMARTVLELVLNVALAHPAAVLWIREWQAKVSCGPARLLFGPVFPPAVALDLHCVDVMLRHIATVVTLLLFFADLLTLRFGYMKSCYNIARYSPDTYIDMLVICVVQLIADLGAGAVTYEVLFLRLRPAFPFRWVLQPLAYQLFLSAVIGHAHGLFISVQGLEGW